jgi:hypothetical protein
MKSTKLGARTLAREAEDSIALREVFLLHLNQIRIMGFNLWLNISDKTDKADKNDIS